MIRIGKDKRSANFLQVLRRERLDGGLRADRGENRCEQIAVGRTETSAAGASVFGGEAEFKHWDDYKPGKTKSFGYAQSLWNCLTKQATSSMACRASGSHGAKRCQKCHIPSQAWYVTLTPACPAREVKYWRSRQKSRRNPPGPARVETHAGRHGLGIDTVIDGPQFHNMR